MLIINLDIGISGIRPCFKIPPKKRPSFHSHCCAQSKSLSTYCVPATTQCWDNQGQKMAKFDPTQPNVEPTKTKFVPAKLVNVAAGQKRPQNALCPDIRCCCKINIPHTCIQQPYCFIFFSSHF